MNRLLRSVRARRAALIPALVLSIAACDEDDPTAVLVQNVADVVVATGDVSTLEAALAAAGLVSALEGADVSPGQA